MKANNTVFSQLSLRASLQDELILLLLPLILFDVILIITACKNKKQTHFPCSRSSAPSVSLVALSG